jgi:hypothetical protein
VVGGESGEVGNPGTLRDDRKEGLFLSMSLSKFEGAGFEGAGFEGTGTL